MSFKIIPKIRPENIQNRDLDAGFLSKYYKLLQQSLLKKTTPENATDYFFCKDFSGDSNLLVMGTQTAAYKKVFKAAGKGKDGFDKANISIGTCYILNEDGANILCIHANSSMSKGKKPIILKALKKMARGSMKKIKEVRWMDAAVVVDATDDKKVESAKSDTDKSEKAAAAAGGEPLVKKDEIVKRTKELIKGIQKLKKDIIPRYKKRETTDRDAAFVKALRKAGLMYMSKLTQTDEATSKKFNSQKKQLEKGLPQWKELEAKILSQKSKSEATATLKKELKSAVNRMNQTRKEVKELLKRVNLKALG